MTTSIHITALDGIVNVNSLFTLAVFIGLTWSPTDPANSLVVDQTCIPGSSVAENLVISVSLSVHSLDLLVL